MDGILEIYIVYILYWMDFIKLTDIVKMQSNQTGQVYGWLQANTTDM